MGRKTRKEPMMDNDVSPAVAAHEMLTDNQMTIDDVIFIYGPQFTSRALHILADMIEAETIVPRRMN